jgi:hypothetical protein
MSSFATCWSIYCRIIVVFLTICYFLILFSSFILFQQKSHQVSLTYKGTGIADPEQHYILQNTTTAIVIQRSNAALSALTRRLPTPMPRRLIRRSMTRVHFHGHFDDQLYFGLLEDEWQIKGK